MKKNLFNIVVFIGCLNYTPVYASALDDLVEEQRLESKQKKAQAEKQQKQKEEQVKKQEQLLIDIADCEQAVAKAIEKRNSISDEETYIINPYVVGATKEGIIKNIAMGMRSSTGLIDFGDIKVKDFAKRGVFVDVFDELKGRYRYFIYTKNTDYATNEKFKEQDLIYKSAGNYKYTTAQGSINSVRAFKATKHKVSEIDPKTYLQNKNLSCCQYDAKDLREVGVIQSTDCSNDRCLYPMYVRYYTKLKCRTRNHPNGVKEEDRKDFNITGTYYYSK